MAQTVMQVGTTRPLPLQEPPDASLIEKLNSHEAHLAALENQRKLLENRCSTLEQFAANLNPNLTHDVLDAQFKTLQQRWSAAEQNSASKHKEVEYRLTKLTSGLDSLAGEIARIDSTIEKKLTSGLDSFAGEIARIDSIIEESISSGLMQRVTLLEKDLKSSAVIQQQMNAAVHSVRAEIRNSNKVTAVLEKKLTQVSSSDIPSRMTVIEQCIKLLVQDLKPRMEQMSSRIEKAESTMQVAGQNKGELEQRIEDLKRIVIGHNLTMSSRIEKAESTMQAAGQDKGELERRIEDLKRKYEALSGLIEANQNGGSRRESEADEVAAKLKIFEESGKAMTTVLQNSIKKELVDLQESHQAAVKELKRSAPLVQEGLAGLAEKLQQEVASREDGLAGFEGEAFELGAALRVLQTRVTAAEAALEKTSQRVGVLECSKEIQTDVECSKEIQTGVESCASQIPQDGRKAESRQPSPSEVEKTLLQAATTFEKLQVEVENTLVECSKEIKTVVESCASQSAVESYASQRAQYGQKAETRQPSPPEELADSPTTSPLLRRSFTTSGTVVNAGTEDIPASQAASPKLPLSPARTSQELPTYWQDYSEAEGKTNASSSGPSVEAESKTNAISVGPSQEAQGKSSVGPSVEVSDSPAAGSGNRARAALQRMSTAQRLSQMKSPKEPETPRRMSTSGAGVAADTGTTQQSPSNGGMSPAVLAETGTSIELLERNDGSLELLEQNSRRLLSGRAVFEDRSTGITVNSTEPFVGIIR